MNSDNGNIYRGEDEITAAKLRGENIVPISEQAANRIEAGYAASNRAARRQAAKDARKDGSGYTR